MKTLQEIKEQVAEECGFTSWDHLLKTIKNDVELLSHYFDGVAKMYAEEAIEAGVVLIEEESWAEDIVEPVGFILSRLSNKIENLKEQLK